MGHGYRMAANIANACRRQDAACRSTTPPLPHRGERGFTLMDTLVALGLMVLVTTTIGQFLVRQARAGSTNGAYTRAYALAAEELEDLRALDYADIVSRSSSMQEGSLSYTVATSVLPDTPKPTMKQIAVTVGWNDPDGPKNVTVHTIFTAVRR